MSGALHALRIDLHTHLQETPPPRRLYHGLKRLAKYALAVSLYYTGLTGRLLKGLLKSRGSALILGYHGVSESPSGLFSSGHAVSSVREQLRFLKRHLRAVELQEIAAAVAQGEAPPPASFAVTFDDGLVNNVLLAIPLLRELDLPVTFFVPSGFVGSSEDLWVASLRELMRSWNEPILQAEPGLWPVLPMQDESSRYAAFFRVKQALKDHERCRREILARLAERAGGHPRPPEGDRVMGPEMLRALRRRGVNVGAHSRTHPILSGLDPVNMQEEIEGSRRELEVLLGEPVLDFAYPNGRFHDFTEETCRLVAEAGYRCAVTTEPGAVRRGDDRLALRRCMPGNVPAFLASFDLLVRVWWDRPRAGDLSRPIGRRRSYLGQEEAELAA